MNVWSFEVVFSEDMTNGEGAVAGQVVLAGITLFSVDVSWMDVQGDREYVERYVMEKYAERLRDTLLYPLMAITQSGTSEQGTMDH